MKNLITTSCFLLIGLFGLNSASLAQSVLYKNGSYSGTSLTLTLDTYITKLGNHSLNDAISSVTVDSGYCVLLTKNSKFEGTAISYSVDTTGFGNFNDEATSALLYEKNPAVSGCGYGSVPMLYKDSNSNGRSWPVTSSTLRPFCDTGSQNCTTIASSLYVPTSMCVYLEGSNGVTQYLFSGNHNLGTYNLNDKVTKATVC